MGYSEIAFASIALADIQVPGKPVVVVVRAAAHEVEAQITLPTQDADGQPLTGMEELVVAIVEEVTPGDNPFAGVAADGLAAFAETNGGQSASIFLVDEDAGALKTNRFAGLTIGKVYWVAATVRDAS